MSKMTMGIIEEVSFRELVNIPSTTYATFGLYRYPAKFIPQVIDYILEKYAEPEMTVFDPFGGYGTVGTVAKIHGNDYELWDLNPMLGILHPIAIMKPVKMDVGIVIKELKASKEKFTPDWSRLANWYPKEFLPFLYRVWGYYHSLDNKKVKMVLTIPLLKTTRYFSYDEMQRQKLSKSGKSIKRIENLLSSDWKTVFYRMLEKEIRRVLKGLEEYEKLKPKITKHVIKAGIDVIHERLKEDRDILITSPPYLQSQEYMRQAKLDLFWLGFSEEKVKKLGKLEIPYRDVDPIPIYSKTYDDCLSHITEPHIKQVFQRYFWGMLGTFTRLQENINSRMFIFVGHSSTRGRAIPIDQILIEHLSKFGWLHEKTLSDKIVSRRLFAYTVNPASKKKDARTSIENLVILKRS